jgi:hypothetical protein
MIVRDEAHGIARTLQSAKPWIDRWCVLDTGSTDGTREIVRNALEGGGVPGALYEVPFENFASTRNRALTFAKDAFPSEFLLLLDADDILEGGEALREWCDEHETIFAPDSPGLLVTDPAAWEEWRKKKAEHAAAREAFFVRTRLGSTTFGSARVVRASAVGAHEREWCERCGHGRKEHGNKGYSGAPDDCDHVSDGPDGAPQEGAACTCSAFVPARGWHYEGAVHEVLVHPSGRQPTITIPGVTIRHERTAESAERTRARWERDVELLREDLRLNIRNARAWFYYARTLQSLGNTAAACRAFEYRIDLGGWPEEVFLAKLGLAQCLDGDEQIAAFLAAAAFAPHRAEPLIELSNIYRNRGAHRLAFMFAREAHRLPFPDDVLFVDADAHGWSAADCVAISAWYCGEHEIGHAAAREALNKCPPEHRERCAKTLAFYESKTS